MLRDLLRYKPNPVRVGAILMAIALLGLGVAYEINHSFSLIFWDKGYELKADFVDADGIANASDVRIAGTYVGQVTQIRSVEGGLAEITIRVDKQYAPLHEGTRANLRLQTLLGTKFIELAPGPSTNKELAVDTVIPTNATQSPVDFDQFLSSFDQPTRDATSNIVKELGTATDGRGQDINNLLNSLHGASVNSTTDLQTFGDRQQNLDSILRNLSDVSGNLADNRQHLANVYTQLDMILATLAANDAGFRRFIEQGNISLGHGLNQFDGQAQNINDIFRLLNPTLGQLNPVLVESNDATVQLDPITKFGNLIAMDIFSANSAYNANSNVGAAPGAGGWFLRQPVILGQSPNSLNDCERNSPPAGCPSSTFSPGSPAAAAAAAAPAPVPPGTKPKSTTPLPVPVPKLPPLPIQIPVQPQNSASPAPGVPGLTQPSVLPTPAVPGISSPLGLNSDYAYYADDPELALFSFLLGAGG